MGETGCGEGVGKIAQQQRKEGHHGRRLALKESRELEREIETGRVKGRGSERLEKLLGTWVTPRRRAASVGQGRFLLDFSCEKPKASTRMDTKFCPPSQFRHA